MGVWDLYYASITGSISLITDSDLVVPCVSSSLREKIMSSAEQTGLTMSKQTEMLGRSATEMILQLIGGGHRCVQTYNVSHIRSINLVVMSL